jgi:hypothetical protein
MKKILTVFAGRQKNLEVLNRYLRKAIDQTIIDEVHFWDFTRNKEDEEYLRSISNPKRVSNKSNTDYKQLFLSTRENSIEFSVMGYGSVYVKLCNKNLFYEIIIGGWSNQFSKNTIYRNGVIFCESENFSRYTIEMYCNTKIIIFIKENRLFIIKDIVSILHVEIPDEFIIDDVFVKVDEKHPADISYETVRNKGFYYMETCDKIPWHNYYTYYDQDQYYEDIVLKCDDDILFIDLEKLPHFIDFVKYHDYDIVFANIINNGVAAYYQQSKYNLIPGHLMQLEYPVTINIKTGLAVPGLEGSLLESGKKAQALHEYFLQNYDRFLNYDYNREIIPIKTRFSINFFGIKCRDWHKIRYCGDDDERKLTIDYVQEKGFNNVMYTDFYVSHLSFAGQSKTGMNVDVLQNKYADLFEKLHG